MTDAEKNCMKKIFLTPILLFGSLFLGCNPMMVNPATEKLTEQTVELLGCPSLTENLLTEIYRVLLTNESFTATQELRRLIMAKTQQNLGFAASDKIEFFTDAYLNFYKFLTSDVAKALKLKTRMQVLEVLTALELGDRSDSVRSRLQDRYQELKAKISQASRSLKSYCDREESANFDQAYLSSDYWGQLRAQLPAVVYGGRKVFATAYQSCDTLNFPPIGEQTPDVQGIRKTSRHPAGGWKREIYNLSLTQQTHYYLQNWRAADQQCTNLPARPLIYDFGGKPKAGSELDSPLDLFSDSGTGSRELGIDCSGFVFSSLASAGLRVNKNVRLKAISVYGISARMFKDPARNGLSCLRQVKPSEKVRLQEGDMIATTGHIIQVDELGPDPFGLSQIQRIEDCNMDTLPTENFDFVVLQSSPSKNGIGINRIAIRDYLTESDSYRSGLLAYAEAACKAQFGKVVAPRNTTISVVRHREEAGCFDRPLALKQESCLSQCPAPSAQPPLN